ncbi:hypothetical protein ACFSC3_14635 [Sphingomonas floccifaciens]|uniref:TonB C-terminal domain-containing protein n=1 Tax=Sphingomonas floccifaciens TaxID=1844115 RepID=A0ABW4NHK6_9SPHN
MLDWRGLVGTSLIHGAVIVGWPALDISPTTMCLCWTPSIDVVEIYEFPKVRHVQLFTNVDPPTGIVEPVYSNRTACSSPPDRAPILVSRPDIPQHLRTAASIAFCASVTTDGTVSALKLLQSGGRPAREIAEVRRLLRQTRFAPSDEPTRIEIAVTS